MARINLGVSPYFDDYDASKQYYQLLAIPGRVAQAREFTQMQTTLRDIIKSIGDSILRNGDIIEGCQVLVSGNTVTVTEGKVYVEGIVMPVVESKVSINGIGTETIGVKLMETIVDENSDNSLRDPAQGYDNYNQPGCTRLKRWLQVVANDSDSATIATLIDGNIMVENYAPEYDVMTQTLARRTYDESGSYIVDGLKSRVENLSDSQYNVVVEAGKAYVLGYELRIPTARRIPSDRATTYNTVTARNNLYRTNNNKYLLDSNPYVKSIVSVNGQVSKTVNQTINTNLDSQVLPDPDVVLISSVTQGDKTFTVGSSSTDGDCYLMRSGNTYMLKWNGTSNYPTAGNSYTVVYTYNKDFVLGKDCELQLDTSNNSHYLVWLSGDTPLNNTIFTVTYEQYLARKDIVYMDKYGNIEILKGIPAESGFEVLPEAPLNTLTLSYIDNPPNGTATVTATSQAVTVRNVGLKRFTMNDIQKLLSRIQTIEYDQAVLSLNDDARQVETTNDKKGIFTEPLIDISRIDFYYNLDASGGVIDATLPIYDMALDLACNICYLPIISRTIDPIYSSKSTAHRYNRLVSLATSGERTILSQPNATKSFLINPYSMFPQMPEVSIDPATDNWIEESIIEVPKSLTDSSVIKLSSRTVDHTTSIRNTNSNWATTSNTSVSDTAIGTRTNVYTSDSVVSENAITYIRQRTVTVEGTNFPAGLENIECYFDGIRVPLTPAGDTKAGTAGGTVNADDKGHLKATFQIPSGVLTGTREVLLKSMTAIDGLITEGFTLYIASGTSRRVERTVTTVTTVLLERVTTTTLTNVYVDPVGQTFVLDRMTILKGIDLYFESKPTVNTPVICEIRGVSNGTINSTVYAHKSLFPQEVITSNNSSAATRFNFDDPVLLEENREYAFVVRSTSDAYRIWVAELGGNDVLTNDLILKNAYMTGVMLSSSNNSSWTSHQTTDIKFQLIEDIYAQNSALEFEDISAAEAARLYLTADAAMPTGTNIDWTYSTDGGTKFNSITPYNINLLNGVYDDIKLRATLSRGTNSNLSPLIALDTVSLVSSHYEKSGCYISSNVAGLDEYTEAKIIVDVYEPASTSINIEVSTDNGKTLQAATRATSTLLNYGWQEVVYNLTVPASTQFKVFIKASSGTNYLTPSFRRLRCIMS